MKFEEITKEGWYYAKNLGKIWEIVKVFRNYIGDWYLETHGDEVAREIKSLSFTEFLGPFADPDAMSDAQQLALAVLCDDQSAIPPLLDMCLERFGGSSKFRCSVCQKEVETCPVPYCEEHCPGHRYDYDAGDRRHYCIYCNTDRPHDYFD